MALFGDPRLKLMGVQFLGSCQLSTQTCDTSMPFKNTYKKQAVHTQKAKLVHGKMVAVLRATTHNTHIPYTMLFLDIFVATVWLFSICFLMITTKSASINPGPNSFRKVPNLDSPNFPPMGLVTRDKQGARNDL